MPTKDHNRTAYLPCITCTTHFIVELLLLLLLGWCRHRQGLKRLGGWNGEDVISLNSSANLFIQQHTHTDANRNQIFFFLLLLLFFIQQFSFFGSLISSLIVTLACLSLFLLLLLYNTHKKKKKREKKISSSADNKALTQTQKRFVIWKKKVKRGVSSVGSKFWAARGLHGPWAFASCVLFSFYSVPVNRLRHSLYEKRSAWPTSH